MANFPALWSKSEQVNPFRAIERMQRQMDRMFDDFLGGNWTTKFPSIPEDAFQPPCDVQETDSHFLFSFDLPGMSKNDVKIELQGNTLRVYGERRDEHRKGKGTNVRTERYFGSIERIMTLPVNAKPESIEAQFENGVLHVVLAKVEVVKPKQVQIGEGKPSLISKLLGSKEEKAA